MGDRLGGGQSAGEGRRLYAGNHLPDMALGHHQFHVCSYCNAVHVIFILVCTL